MIAYLLKVDHKMFKSMI